MVLIKQERIQLVVELLLVEVKKIKIKIAMNDETSVVELKELFVFFLEGIAILME